MNLANRMICRPDFSYKTTGEGTLIVTRTSLFTRKRNTMELPITQSQLIRYTNGGELIQDVFPDLTPDQREFIQSGATPEEWDAMFGGEH